MNHKDFNNCNKCSDKIIKRNNNRSKNYSIDNNSNDNKNNNNHNNNNINKNNKDHNNNNNNIIKDNKNDDVSIKFSTYRDKDDLKAKDLDGRKKIADLEGYLRELELQNRCILNTIHERESLINRIIESVITSSPVSEQPVHRLQFRILQAENKSHIVQQKLKANERLVDFLTSRATTRETNTLEASQRRIRQLGQQNRLICEEIQGLIHFTYLRSFRLPLIFASKTISSVALIILLPWPLVFLSAFH